MLDSSIPTYGNTPAVFSNRNQVCGENDDIRALESTDTEFLPHMRRFASSSSSRGSKFNQI
jgi:hypothetical protein